MLEIEEMDNNLLDEQPVAKAVAKPAKELKNFKPSD